MVPGAVRAPETSPKSPNAKKVNDGAQRERRPLRGRACAPGADRRRGETLPHSARFDSALHAGLERAGYDPGRADGPGDLSRRRKPFAAPGPARENVRPDRGLGECPGAGKGFRRRDKSPRSEEHTSELQSRPHLVCRLLLEKKKN